MFKKNWARSLFVLALLFLSVTTMHTVVSANELSVFYKDSSGGNCDTCDVSIYSLDGKIYQLINDYDTSSASINAINDSGVKLWTYALPSGFSMDVGRTAPTTDKQGNLYVTYKNDDWESAKHGYYLASFNSQGTLNWEFKLDDSFGPTTPIIGNDGTVYFGSGNPTDYMGPFGESFFYAVSPAGELKWSKKIQGDGGTWSADLYFDSEQNIVINTDNNENVLKYTLSPNGDILSTITRTSYWHDKADNEYSVDYQTNTLIAKDKNGKQLWTFQGAATEDYYGGISIEYIKDGGTVFVTDQGSLYSISNGKVNWKSEKTGMVNYHKQGLYLLDFIVDNQDTWEGHSQLYVLDETDGRLKYSQTFNSEFYNMEILNDGSVIYPVGKDIHKVAFSSDVKQTGWVLSSNKWYYYDANGVMKTGWLNDKGTWYYLGTDGVMKTGWLNDRGTWYYLKSTGAMAIGWAKDNGTWYYLKSTGAMATGWVKDNGTWYYLKSSGAMATGWVKDNGTWYYLKSTGAMATGWIKDSGTWYYLKSGGDMVTGWQYIGNKWYYFASTGAWVK